MNLALPRMKMPKIILKKKHYYVIGAAVFIAIIVFFILWGIKTRDVQIVDSSSPSVVNTDKVASCVGNLQGKNFFVINENILEQKVLACDSLITNVTLQKKFPGVVVVTYQVIQPVVIAYDTQSAAGGCVVFESMTRFKTLTSDQCVLFPQAVEISGALALDNKFMFSYIADIVTDSQKREIIVKKVKVMGDKNYVYYQVTLNNNKQVLFPDGADIMNKIAILQASVNGLEQAKEGYSLIDLRFDRVIYR